MPYGVGIVGTGWVAQEYCKAFTKNPHTRVAGLCSRTKEGADAFRTRFGLDAPATDSVTELLSRKDIQVAVITSPNHLHASQALEAARRGIHFVVEKPVALTIQDQHALLRAVKEAGVRTTVGYVLRWMPYIRMARDIIRQGLLGKVFMVEVDYLNGFLNRPRTTKTWSVKRETAGSSLLTAGCHAVDAMLYLAGDDPVEVTAYNGRATENAEFDPTTVFLCRFAGGAIGKVASCLECRMPYRFNVEVYGVKGTLRNNELFTDAWEGLKDFATLPSVAPDSGNVAEFPFQKEVDEFVEAIRENREPALNLAEAARSNELCLAADLSASKGGTPVKLPL